MKQIVIILAFLVLFIGPAISQTDKGSSDSSFVYGESELYPLRLDVIKILSHSQGYKVIYRKGQNTFAEAYIPSSWFIAGGKAVLVKSRGPQYPYMVIYYKQDGSFSHVKLYALSDLKDSSWGVMDGDPGDSFKVDTIKVQY